jgi:hypothetical protein
VELGYPNVRDPLIPSGRGSKVELGFPSMGNSFIPPGRAC